MCESDARLPAGVKAFSSTLAVVLGLLTVVRWTVSANGDSFTGDMALVVSMEAGSGQVC